MPNHIKFNNGVDLEIKFVKSEFVDAWLSMVRNRPIDTLKMFDVVPDINRFNDLRKECDRLFGWTWSGLELTQENFNHMHKDLERLESVPAELGSSGHPVHALHALLHILENYPDPLNIAPKPRKFIRFLSFHHDRIPISDPNIYQKHIEPGHLILDYPYIGRTPLNAAKHHDDSDVLMTVIPMLDACTGFQINCQTLTVSDSDMIYLEKWLDGPGKDLCDRYGKQTILDTTGFPVIGHVINKNDLTLISTGTSVIDIDL